MESVRVTVESRSTNSKQNPLIRCMIPGYGRYPIPLNLTPEQGERLAEGKNDYDAILVRGALKDGKSGDFPDHFWWNVAMFEGIVDERTMAQAQAQPEQNGATVASPTVPSATSPGEQEVRIMRGGAIKVAGPQITRILGEDATVDEVFAATCQLTERYIGYLVSGRYDGMVDATIQTGATLVDVESEPEPTYVYPEPPKRVTEDAFNVYVDSAGWSWDDVERWLDGLHPHRLDQTGEGAYVCALPSIPA